jgi:hypothetical protein
VCFDGRRSTRDLDAVFAPTEFVRRAAATVAEHEGLDPDWLNAAVKGFLPGPDPNAVRYFEAPGLLVDVAAAEYLLAMKLFSSRVEADADDIALLYREVIGDQILKMERVTGSVGRSRPPPDPGPVIDVIRGPRRKPCRNPLITSRAGDRDRTGMTSLEGWGSTIELHPQWPLRGLAKGI